jgi:hypothetical protein
MQVVAVVPVIPTQAQVAQVVAVMQAQHNQKQWVVEMAHPTQAVVVVAAVGMTLAVALTVLQQVLAVMASL